MHKRIFLFVVVLGIAGAVRAQELQARFTVLASKVSTQVDKKVFLTLQSALTNFLNNRRWTNDAFKPEERIQCSFLLTIDHVKAWEAAHGEIKAGEWVVLRSDWDKRSHDEALFLNANETGPHSPGEIAAGPSSGPAHAADLREKSRSQKNFWKKTKYSIRSR